MADAEDDGHFHLERIVINDFVLCHLPNGVQTERVRIASVIVRVPGVQHYILVLICEYETERGKDNKFGCACYGGPALCCRWHVLKRISYIFI